MTDIALILKAIPVISTLYDRLFQRPDLGLEIEKTQTNVYGGAVHLIPNVIIWNRGRGAADEAHLEMSLSAWDFEQDEETDYPSNGGGDWKTRYSKTGYFGKTGHHHVLHFEDTIPARTPAHIFLGSLSFEKNSTYELEYHVRCAAHRPRKGKVVFETSENGVEISNKRPSLFIGLADAISNLVGKFRYGSDNDVYVVTDLRFTSTEEDDLRIAASAAIRNNTGSFISYIDANLWIERDDGESTDHSGAAKNRAYAIAPGEQWIVQETYTLSDSDFEIERWYPNVDIDYDTTDSWEFPRGIELVSVEKTPAENRGAGFTSAQVEGTVKNTNQVTSEPFSLVVKFKSADGALIETKSERLRLEPQSTHEFNSRTADADFDLQRSVESIQVFLKNENRLMSGTYLSHVTTPSCASREYQPNFAQRVLLRLIVFSYPLN